MVIALAFSIGCSPRPAALETPRQVAVPGVDASRALPALWIAMTNYSTGGSLARLDVATGRLDPSVLSTGPDAALVSDVGSDFGGELFLLTRGGRDSVARVISKDGRWDVTPGFDLDSGFNAQAAARDNQGRVWVTGINSNSVLVLAPSLDQRLGTVDLSALVEPSSEDGFAELGSIVPCTNSDSILVLASRLRRTRKGWIPDAQGGVATLSSSRAALVSTELVAAPNLAAGRCSRGLGAQAVFDRSLIGSGDLSQTHPNLLGTWLAGGAVQQQGGLVVAPLLRRLPGTQDAWLLWQPATQRMCGIVNGDAVYCQTSAESGGYLFGQVAAIDHALFLAYTGGGSSELWMLDTRNPGQITRIPLPMPVQGMTVGP